MKSTDSSGAARRLNLFINPGKTLKYAFITDREFTLLIIAGFISGIAEGINTSIFNN